MINRSLSAKKRFRAGDDQLTGGVLDAMGDVIWVRYHRPAA
ncbi:hypothetical protein [Bradyrhizobium sp. 150]|nr:hypothetical protein [Bradyrhizobium sp. 150]